MQPNLQPNQIVVKPIEPQAKLKPNLFKANLSSTKHEPTPQPNKSQSLFQANPNLTLT